MPYTAVRAPLALTITLPAWLADLVAGEARHRTPEARMRVVIDLARENVRRGTGGPFAAAVFDADGGMVSAGVNVVVPARNSTLHAELVALAFAEQRLGSHSLGGRGLELVTSCAPCAMCLGAIHWSGIRRVVIGAPRAAAARIGFDEGPVFDASYRYLEDRGVDIVSGVLADEATAVLDAYGRDGGEIYNG